MARRRVDASEGANRWAKIGRRKEDEKAPTFEAAMGELEQIVRELEDGEIDLEAALTRYERGVKLLRPVSFDFAESRAAAGTAHRRRRGGKPADRAIFRRGNDPG